MFSSETKTAAELTKASAENDVKSEILERAKAAEHAAKQFYDQARDYADDTSKKIRKIADHARSDLKTAADEAAGRVRSDPLPSALAILSVGFLVGFLFRNSHRA